jgi:hypothetical protein
MPTIGFLHSGSPREYPFVVDAFRQGLKETGNEGLNVAVECRWAQDHPDQLPVLANELVRRVCIAPARGAALRGIRALSARPQSGPKLIAVSRRTISKKPPGLVGPGGFHFAQLAAPVHVHLRPSCTQSQFTRPMLFNPRIMQRLITYARARAGLTA